MVLSYEFKLELKPPQFFEMFFMHFLKFQQSLKFIFIKNVNFTSLNLIKIRQFIQHFKLMMFGKYKINKIIKSFVCYQVFICICIIGKPAVALLTFFIYTPKL